MLHDRPPAVTTTAATTSNPIASKRSKTKPKTMMTTNLAASLSALPAYKLEAYESSAIPVGRYEVILADGEYTCSSCALAAGLVEAPYDELICDVLAESFECLSPQDIIWGSGISASFSLCVAADGVSRVTQARVLSLDMDVIQALQS